MQRNERICVRMTFDQKVIKNLLMSDVDLARRMSEIRRASKIKETYLKAKQEVKKKAAEAVEKGADINLKKIDQAFADGVYYAFTMSILIEAIDEAVENDIQKSLKRYMLENMTEGFMIEIIEKVVKEQIDTIEEFVQDIMRSEKFIRLLEDIFGEEEEE